MKKVKTSCIHPNLGRLANVSILPENKIGGNSGLEKIQAMAEHIEKADNFSKKIVDSLNEILVKNNVEFQDEKEKDT